MPELINHPIMPAVQLETLDAHINVLAWKFTRPADFRHSLSELLSLYGDRLYRPGHTVQKKTGINVYRVPPIVLQKLEIKLSEWTQENPDAAFVLAGQLFLENYFEIKTLAAHILGQLPVSFSSQVIHLVKNWAVLEKDRILLDEVFSGASYRLRVENQPDWIELSMDWLKSPEQWSVILGLRSLVPLIQDRSFMNLPMVYDQVLPLLDQPPFAIQNDLIHVLEVLIARSPNEMAYLFQRILKDNQDIGTGRLLRKLLPSFPAHTQNRVREFFTGD